MFISINHAILGLLSCRPLTGYDLKKMIQESPFMPWSGNNNQIYKSLVELLEDGCLTHETQHRESAPTIKIYTITEKGLAELKKWLLASAEPPEFKKMFLVQLAWAEQLSSDELNALISNYEDELNAQIAFHEERVRREAFSPGRDARETVIWDMIHENVLDFYKNEWKWIQKLRKQLPAMNEEETK